jgi:hypothetical protein
MHQKIIPVKSMFSGTQVPTASKRRSYTNQQELKSTCKPLQKRQPLEGFGTY